MRNRHAQRGCAGESLRAGGHPHRHRHLFARRGARHRGQPDRQQPRRAFSPSIRRSLADARGRARMALRRSPRRRLGAERKGGRPHGVRVLTRKEIAGADIHACRLCARPAVPERPCVCLRATDCSLSMRALRRAPCRFRLIQERYSAPLYRLICIFEKLNGCARVLARPGYIVCCVIIS